jgi:RNA-directed DNA polymerase
MVSRKQSQLFYTAHSRSEGNPAQRFTALYGLLLWEPWLYVALEQVLANTGAKTPGIDGVTKTALQEATARDALVTTLRDQLRDETYRPQPVRRVFIPKANGQQRPLGIPTISDRVVQAAVKNLLEPIFEAYFEDCSYGFRPNRGCWDALAEIGQYLKRPSNYEWVVEGDIRDCFGSIDHDILMGQLRRRIGDHRLLTLIWRMLKAGVLQDLRYYSTDTGTPQGGIVSPLLANIYLHQLDEWAAQRSHRFTVSQRYYRRSKGEATLRLTRYADDFLIAVKGTREQAEAIRAEVADLLRTQMRMELSLDKTLITHRTTGFVFLGVTVKYEASRTNKDSSGQGRGNVYFLPSPKAITRYKAKVEEMTEPTTNATRDVEVIRAINRFSIGWANYYRHGNSTKVHEALDYWTWHRVFRWLQRRHKLGPRAALKRFWVDAKTPVNCHPTRTGKRLGAWDGEGLHLAIWPLTFTPIKYWKYRGNNIPRKYKGESKTRPQPEPPEYGHVPWREGENPHHTAEYRNAREAVRLREKFRCQNCGAYAPQGSEVHHKDGNPENNDLDNLELRCHKCHVATDSYGKRKA